jgi:hypothetical protein
VRALLVLRLGPGKMPAGPDIEEARINYERLSMATAQRVLTFWRLRDKGAPRLSVCPLEDQISGFASLAQPSCHSASLCNAAMDCASHRHVLPSM